MIMNVSALCLQLYVRHKEYLNSLVGQDFEMVSLSNIKNKC